MKLAEALARAREAPVIVLLVGLFIYFSATVPRFADPQGLLDILRFYTPHAILAVGLTLVIGTAGIDISVGSVLGFSGVLLGVALSRSDASLAVACTLALGGGAAFGLFNGWGVARLGIQPVVVTLSTMAAARGLAYIIAGQGVSSIDLPHRAASLEHAAYVSPMPLLLAVAVAVGGAIVLNRTTFGRTLLAVGGNEEAARLSGVAVRRVKLAVYTLTGALAGLTGILNAGMMYTATTDAGMGYEFEAITAVLIGGTSIAGGEATVIGSVLGVMLAAMLNRGFDLVGISDLWRMMGLGLILILSVLLDRGRRSLAHRRAIRKADL